MTKLNEWVNDSDARRFVLSQAIDCGPRLLSKYLNGRDIPRGKVAEVMRVTGLKRSEIISCIDAKTPLHEWTMQKNGRVNEVCKALGLSRQYTYQIIRGVVPMAVHNIDRLINLTGLSEAELKSKY